jgi:hypothetical protein
VEQLPSVHLRSGGGMATGKLPVCKKRSSRKILEKRRRPPSHDYLLRDQPNVCLDGRLLSTNAAAPAVARFVSPSRPVDPATRLAIGGHGNTIDILSLDEASFLEAPFRIFLGGQC